MNFTIGYTIFNQEALIEPIVDALSVLRSVGLMFLFDGCTDGSVAAFKKHRHRLGDHVAFVNEGYDFFEPLANNVLLRAFQTDCCILFQGDMVVKSDSFLRMTERILEDMPDAGLIGFKDGYEMPEVDRYENMVSSPFSHSKARSATLGAGEYVVRTFVNRGPIAFSRRVIERVGLLDEAYDPLFWDDNDYCMKCRAAGMRNVVAHGEIETLLQWGATRKGSKLPCQLINAANRWRFARRWSVPCPRTRIWQVLRGLAAIRRIRARRRLQGVLGRGANAVTF